MALIAPIARVARSTNRSTPFMAIIASRSESARWQPAEQLRNVVEVSGKAVWRHRRPLSQCCLRTSAGPASHRTGSGRGSLILRRRSSSAHCLVSAPAKSSLACGMSIRETGGGPRIPPRRRLTIGVSKAAAPRKADAMLLKLPAQAFRPEIAAEQQGAHGQKYQDHGEAEAAANARTRYVVIMAKQCVITRQQAEIPGVLSAARPGPGGCRCCPFVAG
jgi:hypothetical protein